MTSFPAISNMLRQGVVSFFFFVKKMREILIEVSLKVDLHTGEKTTPGNRTKAYAVVCRLTQAIVFQSSNFVHISERTVPLLEMEGERRI
jgi:hypothetical protein